MKTHLLLLGLVAAVSGVAAPERTQAFKIPSAMETLRPGEVRPQGWLRDRCVAAKNGYVSRLDEVDQAFPRAWNSDFHPRGKYLDWGDPNQGAWCTEGGAYWFEGLVRLAWELDDPALKAYAKKRLTPLLERMNPNALGFVYWMDRRDPAQLDELEKANHGFIIGASGRTTRAFLAYYEATGDERALQALKWCLDDPRCYFFGNPVTLPAAGCDTWRYCGDGKLAAALENFYAKYPTMSADKWPALRYGHPVRPETIHLQVRDDKNPNANWEWRLQHGVLSHESAYSFLKLGQWTGDAKLVDNVRAWADYWDAHTRQVHGVTVADEQYGAPGADRGTETCTVAGDLLLYATLAGVTGEGRFGDHVERSFFNAGAACVSRDWMNHVYFQAPNRTTAKGRFCAGPCAKGGVYRRKHWPLCCTAALTRILPGYVQWMWMKPAAGGLAAVLYGPNTLQTDVAGTAVRVETETAYPFDETIAMTVRPAKTATFPLRLRIPAWCVRPSVSVNGDAVDVKPVGGFATVVRAWRDGDRVTLNLPMAPKVEKVVDRNQDNRAYCSVTMGPLLFAYAVPSKDENTPLDGARTDWTLDSSKVLDGARVMRTAMPKVWDWPTEAPVRVSVRADGGQELALVPYGCARLRVSMFPDRAGLPDWSGGRMAEWAKGAHQIKNTSCANGEIVGRATGADPFWTVGVKPFKPTATQEVVFRGKSCVKGTGEFFWAPVTAKAPVQATGTSFEWIGDGQWHEYRVRPFWQAGGDIHILRIDFPSGSVEQGEIGIADVRVVDEGTGASMPIAGAAGVSFVCTAKKPGRGKFTWVADSLPGRQTERFPLAGDGRPHRYFLPLRGTNLKGSLVDWSFCLASTAEELPVGDFRVCMTEPDLPPDLVRVGALFATPACRAGTEGRIEVSLRNVGTEMAKDVALRVTGDSLPAGVSFRPEPPKDIVGGGAELLAVGVGSDKPFEGTVRLALESSGKTVDVFDVPVRILPSLGLPKAAYVPEPKPVQSDYEIGALYFPGWERAEAWKRVWQTCPERRPYLGWYDEANPEVVDWQIKWLVEHGVSVLYVDWYWYRGGRHHEHWVQAFQRAKWRKHLKWALMWANHTPQGTHSEADQRAVTKYWIDHYFNTPEYLQRDGKPVVWIWQSQNLDRDCGKDGCRKLLDLSRQMAVEAGFKGIHFMAMKWPEAVCTPGVMRQYREQGFDEIGIYHFMSHGGKTANDRRFPFNLAAEANPANWWEQQKSGVMPFLPNLSTGWDDRPWNDGCEIYGKNAADFRRICVEAKKFADATGVKRLCLSPLNEWGEGSYAEPNAEHGFGFYDAVRDVFCKRPAEGWPVDCVPADVGLGPYDLPLPPQPHPVSSWDFTKGNRHGWQAFMGCSRTQCTAEGLAFETTTHDPAMHVPFVRLRTQDHASVTVRMKAENAQGHAVLFWARELDGMREAANRSLPVVSDGKFHDYVFKLSGHPCWKGGVGALRFDPCENAGAKITVSSIRLNPASAWKGAYVDGATAEGKCFYKVGETMTFRLKIGGIDELPAGKWTFRWRRTGDDGKTEEGTAPVPFKEPFVYRTSIAKPGFVRLYAEVVGAGANVKFDGGAGADFDKIVQEQGEPADFDAFWARELEALAQVPFNPQLEEVESPRKDVKLCRFSLGCTHGKPSTGFISIPCKPGKYPIRLRFFGYNESWSPRATAFPTREQAPADEIVLRVNAHGLENGRDEAYYAAARKLAGSNGYGHGFDPAQNAKPETCYFLGMILRDVRAAQYAKTLPEWDGKTMRTYGGSQGGAQSLWVTALEPAVTDAEVFIPWMCDWRGKALGGRQGTDWGAKYAPGLDYFDCVNFAKRIRPDAYVNIFHAGLGDYICPPAGVTSLYHALKCRKRIRWVQNAEHGWSSPAKNRQTAEFTGS